MCISHQNCASRGRGEMSIVRTSSPVVTADKGERRNRNIAEGDCCEIASFHALQYVSACICFLVGAELCCFPVSLHIRQLHSFQNVSFFLQLLLFSWKVLTRKVNHGFKGHHISQSGLSRVSIRDENINLITKTTLNSNLLPARFNLMLFFTPFLHFLLSVLSWLCVFAWEPSYPEDHSHIYNSVNWFIQEPEVLCGRECEHWQKEPRFKNCAKSTVGFWIGLQKPEKHMQ